VFEKSLKYFVHDENKYIFVIFGIDPLKIRY